MTESTTTFKVKRALTILHSQKMCYSTNTKGLDIFQTGTTFYLGIVHYLVFYTEKP